jgi:hypothetical protein
MENNPFMFETTNQLLINHRKHTIVSSVSTVPWDRTGIMDHPNPFEAPVGLCRNFVRSPQFAINIDPAFRPSRDIVVPAVLGAISLKVEALPWLRIREF